MIPVLRVSPIHRVRLVVRKSSPIRFVMDILDFFDRVYIISLDSQVDRRSKLIEQLNQLGVYPPFLEVFSAVHGDSVGVPAWWKSGGGAWGCLLSHAAVLQDAVKRKLSSYLVLEDDAIFSTHADSDLSSFLKDVPDDWEQVYLGGVNLLEPIKLSPTVIRPKDMNRTHAYGLSASAYQRFHQHIFHAPDYISAYNDGWYPHFDHQLGLAHRRGDWNVYAPTVNIVGQRENHSDINRSWHPDKWWDWNPEGKHVYLPFLIIKETENSGLFKHIRGDHNRGKNRWGEVAKYVHFGWRLGGNKLTFEEAYQSKEDPCSLLGAFVKIAQESWDCRRLPAFYGTDAQCGFLESFWPGGTINLPDLSKRGDILQQLEKLCDYPHNGLLEQHKKCA